MYLPVPLWCKVSVTLLVYRRKQREGVVLPIMHWTWGVKVITCHRLPQKDQNSTILRSPIRSVINKE